MAALAALEMCSWAVCWLISGFSTFSFNVQLKPVWLPATFIGKRWEWKGVHEENFYQSDLNLIREKTVPCPFLEAFSLALTAIDSICIEVFSFLYCSPFLMFILSFLSRGAGKNARGRGAERARERGTEDPKQAP